MVQSIRDRLNLDVILEQTAAEKEHPEQIFLHTGTKHFDEPDFQMDENENYYVEIIFKMKEMFPNTIIIVSSILPRKELAMKMLIASLNDFLLGMCTNTPNTEFMRNNNIKHYMLTDKKHINENGFKTMLSNIRYTIFGRIPRVSPNSTNNRRIHLDSSLR